MASVVAGCGGDGTGGHADSAKAITTERNSAACTDFYAYANAAWIAATPIPPAFSSIDLATGLAARNQKALLAELDRLGAGGSTASTSDQLALVNLDASRADTAAVERAGLAPLADDLTLIDRLTGVGQLPATWGQLIRHGVRLPVALKFNPFDDPDASDPTMQIDWLTVTLDPLAPSRVVMKKSRDAARDTALFQAHVARTLELVGMPAVEAGIAVVAIEEALAEGTRDDAETGAEATATGAAPVFAISDLLTAAGVPNALPRRVEDVTLRVLSRLQDTYGARQWRDFMRWRLIRSFTNQLPARFAAERARWDFPAFPSNLPSFSRHYGCVAGDPMARSPQTRLALW